MSAHITNPVLYSSQEIDNESYNDTYKIKETALYVFNATANSFVPVRGDAAGNILTGSGASPSAIRLDNTSTANIIYVGKAAPGTATSSTIWQVQKIDQSTGTVITWADTGKFTQIWDNRVGLTYA